MTTHDPSPASAPQIVRGRPFRTLRDFLAISAIGFALLFAAGTWINHEGPTQRRRSLDTALILLSVAVVAGVALAIAAALTTARVRNGNLRLTFCGVPTKTIPLDTITAFTRFKNGRVRGIRILHGHRSSIPNSLLNPDDLAALLSAHGVPEHPDA